MVDFEGAGSYEAAADDPKFSLKTLFQHKICLDVAELIGQYYGYTPVVQGDNTGSREERGCIPFLNNHFEDKGWKWEPQATQMRHMNNYDISVFTCMSKRHTNIARSRVNLHMLSEDKIEVTANDIWKKISNNKIASGSVQAYRVAEKQ